MKGEKKELFGLLVSVNLFTVITILVFAPYEIFIFNRNDFEFAFLDFFWIPLLAGIIYMLIVTLLGMILPVKICKALVVLEFALTLCCYIQAMFLNGGMESLLGQEVSWGIKLKILNAIIWIVIISLIFLLTKKAKTKGNVAIKFCSLAITAMQLVALVSLLLTTDVLNPEREQEGYFSDEGMLSLNTENNVVVFLLDFFDGRTMDKVLQEYPDILSELEGFTYYPNATSVHSRTYPSVTYLLTGNMCHYDMDYREYVNLAHQNGELLPALHEENIDIGLYTFEQYIGDNVKEYITNWCNGTVTLEPIELQKYLLKMTLYRDMPYLFKARFEYEISEINSDVKIMDNPYEKFNDEWLKGEFAKGISLNHDSDAKGVFRFFHMAACHRNLTKPVEPSAYALEVVNDYLRQMKDMGVYDNSTILIITDHGHSGGGETLDMPHETAVPIFFVKPAGSVRTEMKISDAPISQTDFIPTVLDGFGLDYKEVGRAVYDIDEEEKRERKYYYSALFSDEEGEIELREYSVIGDAREASSYNFTGNKWDIQYSENKVAD